MTRHADLAEENLAHANLAGDDLEGADLRGANPAHAVLRGTNLARAHLVGADLTGADLSAVDQTEADLTEAQLVGARLRDTELGGADLRRADLAGADLTQARSLDRARLDETRGVPADRRDRARPADGDGKARRGRAVPHGAVLAWRVRGDDPATVAKSLAARLDEARPRGLVGSWGVLDGASRLLVLAVFADAAAAEAGLAALREMAAGMADRLEAAEERTGPAADLLTLAEADARAFG